MTSKNPYDFNFIQTPFNELMKRRIAKVLVICSSYDYFILEEDGRIDEQIFNEYVSLNLRYPPQFIQVPSSTEAFKVLKKENIDLVITMLSAVDVDSFELANQIKEKYPEKPIVILTPFSREVSMRIKKHDLSSIDYVFSWLGNADILLAIIKLIEDKNNVDNDVKQGVQTILMVEDSVRFYSSYLPTIYKIIFTQSLSFMTEGLNEHQRMLRMRGRPKIILARNYNEAIQYYEKYKSNLLGVISDISYKRDGLKDKFAGISLARQIKSDDRRVPILLQSSDRKNERFAKEIRVGFLDKYSKNLLNELRYFIKRYFAFGDFIFIDPKHKNSTVGRASDLKSLQRILHEIPDDSLDYHTSRYHISKWLNARALFPLAKYLKAHSHEDFEDISEVRDFICKAISRYRTMKSRGIIAKFYREKYDESLIFTRIGDGSLGGKARGLAFLDSIIKRHKLEKEFDDVLLTIPKTIVISSDAFDEFMIMNDLFSIALSDTSDQEVLNAFINANLPNWLIKDLDAVLNTIKNPIAVRSSSILEDSHYQPFAGVYSTYMIPNSSNKNEINRLQLEQAIKSVYASVYYKETKAYMHATSNVIDEEKMSIVLQEVCGTKYNDRFYPTFSGVARSVNFYPIHPEKTNEGVVNIALGLGKQIVEGGKSLRFSPRYPKRILQLTSPSMALKETQKHFKALDLNPDNFNPSKDEGINILNLRIKEAEKDKSIKDIASTYDFSNDMLVEGTMYEGKKLITFSNVLKYNTFPLADIMLRLLNLFEQEMNNPIEIEFAVNLKAPKNERKLFNLLQIRPIVDTDQSLEEDISNIDAQETIINSNSVLGNGTINDVTDIIYLKPEVFDASNNQKIVPIIEKLNKKFVDENKYYVLVGPGRWGSSDHWLGVPVKWAQISNARLIVESNLEEYRIDPSQGTHFFQNLTSFRVGYFTVNSYINDGFFDVKYLNKINPTYEDQYLRHVKFHDALSIKIDGKKNIGIVLKPKQ